MLGPKRTFTHSLRSLAQLNRYNSWTSALDNATEFPYFARVGPANSDIGKVYSVFMRSIGWKKIAVVTDDDAYTADMGMRVANDMKMGGGEVLYRSSFPTLPADTAVDLQGALHAKQVKIISDHLDRALEAKARIVFMLAKGDATKEQAMRMLVKMLQSRNEPVPGA